MNYEGEEFLNRLFKDLALSEEVKHTRKKSDKPAEAIKRYMDRLERIHGKAFAHNKLDYIKKLYFDKYVIKRENIPNGLDADAIINVQKSSLESWLNYLTDENTKYPMWVKYWIFQGMLKLGTYNEGHETYQRRSDKTLAKFVDCNPEIIAYCARDIMDFVSHGRTRNEETGTILKSGSFKKLFEYYEKKFKSVKKRESVANDGIWVKYDQGNREQAIALSKSLWNKNTGWCTANEPTAIAQVCGDGMYDGGDFYIYYTKDENGKYSMPRIAIRMLGTTSIAEIRGIEENQNLEVELLPVLEQKLKSFTFLDDYERKKYLTTINGLRWLVEISKKTAKREPLSSQEIIDLYCVRYGFGWENDPLVARILKERKILDDYNTLRNQEHRVAFLKMHLSSMPSSFTISDKKMALDVVGTQPVVISYLSNDLKKDTEFIKEMIRENHFCYGYIPRDLLKDREFILSILNRPLYYRLCREGLIDESIFENRETIKKLLETDGDFIEIIPEKYRSDKELILLALKSLNFSPPELDKALFEDRDFLLRAIEADPNVFKQLDDNFKDDKQIVLEVVKRDGKLFQYASDRLRNDRDVVYAACCNFKHYYMDHPLQYASDRLKDDKNLIISILNSVGKKKFDVGRLLEYVSDRLRDDREVIITACCNCDYLLSNCPLQYASDRLKDDKSLFLTLYSSLVNRFKLGFILQYASDRLKDDKELVSIAVARNGSNLEYASERLKNNRQIALKACRDHFNPEFIGETLRNNKSFLLDVIRLNHWAFSKLPEELKKDRQFVLDAVKANMYVLDEIDPMFLEDKEIILEAVRRGRLKYIKKLYELGKSKENILSILQGIFGYTKDTRGIYEELAYFLLRPDQIETFETGVKSISSKFKPVKKVKPKEEVKVNVPVEEQQEDVGIRL